MRPESTRPASTVVARDDSVGPSGAWRLNADAIDRDSEPGALTTLCMHARTRIAAALVVIGVATLVAFAYAPGHMGRSVTVTASAERAAIEQGGLVYEFHALTGTESLWDTSLPATERRNLIRERADDAHRLRRLLEAELSDPGFALLRGSRAASIERLKKLGYL